MEFMLIESKKVTSEDRLLSNIEVKAPIRLSNKRHNKKYKGYIIERLVKRVSFDITVVACYQ